MTPPMLAAIQTRISELLVDIREIRIEPRNGSTVTVTLDAGYGTHSFVVNRNGRVFDAGFGEHVERSEPVEQDPSSGRWYALDEHGERLHGPYLEEREARAATRDRAADSDVTIYGAGC